MVWKVNKVSLAWVLFVLWLSHIARYAPEPAGQKSLQASDPSGPEIL